MKIKQTVTAVLCLFVGAGSAWSQPVGTAFTYQGRLVDGAGPANGTYDIQFKLFDAVAAGAQVGTTVTKAGVTVSAGLFTTSLDFGVAAFVGTKRWLEIGVKLPAAASYTLLTPRQELTPSPNAVFSSTTGDPAVQRRTVAPSCPVGKYVQSLAADGTPTCVDASGGGVSGVTTSAPLASSGGVAPNISLAGIVGIPNGGTGSDTQNFVDLTTNQTVAGNKTLTGNLALAASTLTAGNITKGGFLFLHNFGNVSTFIGRNAGNLTMTGGANTATGDNTLQADTSGSNNTANGEGALRDNTTGHFNTAIGARALQSNTGGAQNTGSGMWALQGNTTGSQNTANGISALHANTVGAENTASGGSALSTNTTGNRNTANGLGALSLNSAGNDNTATGHYALLNATGSGNIAIGKGAGQLLTTGNDNIDIGNAGVAGEGGTIRIGTAGTHTATFIAGNTTTFAGNVAWSGTASGNIAGSSASVTGVVPIVNGGTGSPTQNFVDLNTAQAVAGNKTFSSLLTLGDSLELQNSSATLGNITKGGVSFIHNIGADNTAIGLSALATAGSGFGNTASGSGALSRNTTGIANTASGAYGLGHNTTGSYNTATGVFALSDNTSGNYNIAYGEGALRGNTIGENNIAIGMGAGSSLTIGDNNIAIGHPGVAGEGNTIRIGHPSFHTATFIAGDTTTFSGNIAWTGTATGSVAGSSVTGTVAVANGGTGATTPAAARTNLGAAASGVNNDITSLGTSYGQLVSVAAINPSSASGAAAITGRATSATGTTRGVWGTSASTSGFGAGVLGFHEGTTGNGWGVYGQSQSNSGVGVYGTAPSVTGLTYGVFGTVTSPAGYGLYTPNRAYVGGDLVLSTGNIMKGASRFIHNFGTRNTFVGVNAGSVLTGIDNTGNGDSALQNNTTGDGNTAAGSGALALNTKGSNNTAGGAHALHSNTTAGGNVAVGWSAMYNQSFSNVDTPWTTANTALGYQALASNQPTTDNNGNVNTATGANALMLNTIGRANTASGASALMRNTTGNNNTASGAFALWSNTTGYSNTASGSAALYANTAGLFNTANGDSALENNKTASGNVAVGISALQSQSFDPGSAWNSYNTAVGFHALLNNQPTSTTTGYQNTAVGWAALLNNTTGAFNTAIGVGADVTNGAFSNSTAIGYGAKATASNMVRVGNSSVTLIQGAVAFDWPSDRTKKENFREVNAEEVLAKLRAMGVTSWNYIGHDPKEFRHYGPMAQDFFAAFGRDEVGVIGTDTTINSGDIAGILLIGLKGLDAQVQRDRQVISALTAELVLLKAQVGRIAELEQQAARVAALLEGLAPKPAAAVSTQGLGTEKHR